MKKQIEFKVKIPTKVTDIKLYQYQKLMEYRLLVVDTKVPAHELFMRYTSMFCDMSYAVVRDSMSISDIQIIGSKVAALLEKIESKSAAKDIKFNPFITILHKKCGFITNFEEMTGGEFSDLSGYITDWASMHSAMAVLYRPIVKKKRNFLLGITQYKVTEYVGTSQYADAMKQMPAITVLQTLVFIESSYQSCQSIFLTYTQNLLKKIPSRKLGRDMDLKKLSKIIGDGINHSMQ